MSTNGSKETANFRWYVWLLFLYIPIGAFIIYILREIQCRRQGIEASIEITIPDKPVMRKTLDKNAKKVKTPASSLKKKSSQPDDLKKIEGIGPKISQALAESGVDTYRKLARMKAEDIKSILEEKGVRIGFPETWPEQANLAALGDWEGLMKLQESLKGGRKA